MTASGTRPRRRGTSVGRREAESLGPLEAVIQRHVRGVIARSATFAEAADRLGIDLATLWRMRKRWGLD